MHNAMRNPGKQTIRRSVTKFTTNHLLNVLRHRTACLDIILSKDFDVREQKQPFEYTKQSKILEE